MKTLPFTLIFISSIVSLAFSTVKQFPLQVISQEERIARDVLASFQKEDYDTITSLFHVSLKQALPKERLAEIWESIHTNYGDFETITSVKTKNINEVQGLELRCKFVQDNLTMDLYFNKEKKLIGIYFRPY
jgi:hypothetical protein